MNSAAMERKIRRLEDLLERFIEQHQFCDGHLWDIVEVAQGQDWTGNRHKCTHCGAPEGLVLLEMPSIIKPSPCQNACSGVMDASFDLLTDAETEAVVQESEKGVEGPAHDRWRYFAETLAEAQVSDDPTVRLRARGPFAECQRIDWQPSQCQTLAEVLASRLKTVNVEEA